MRVRTTPMHSFKLKLEVERKDTEGDIYIASQYDGFYLPAKDVPAFIKALKWASK